MVAVKTHNQINPKQSKSKKQLRAEDESRFPDIFSPEGFLAMTWAMVLDLLGLVDLIPAIGNVASILVSILGMSTLGIWAFMKTGHMPPHRRNRYMLKRPITRGLIGWIPFLAALPLWSFWVFKACKKGGDYKAATAGFASLAIVLLGFKIAVSINWILL